MTMTDCITLIILPFGCCRRFIRAVGTLVYAVLLTACFHVPVLASDEEPVFYETSIFVVVQGIGGTEIPAIIGDEIAYLSVTDMFTFLKIKNSLSQRIDSISGFFITEQATFVIDQVHNCIQYQGKTYPLKKYDIIRTANNIYLKTAVFGSVFGLECKFNFRSLSVNVSTKFELPAIREMRQEMMHRNINRLRGQLKADTVIGRSYPLFQFGMADWSVIATQRSQGGSDTRLNLSLGGILAGGEANVSLNYNNFSLQQQPLTHDSSNNIIKPFDERLQYYRWRFVNNDNQVLRQIVAGKIFAQSTASIYAPVIGVQFTNTPSTYRRSFGSYTLSNFTEPGWAVELYVNNELVDYTKADASGFFIFQVPLVYGNSLVKLRFYSPWGEERFREENISIPFNFLPHREFEYTASAGVVEDSSHSQYARIALNYGATRRITIGGGVEYLSSVIPGKTMPFVNASLRIGSNLLFTTDYTYNVRARAIMNYRLPSNLQFEGNYTRYKKDQKAIIYNYLEERKLMISKPFTGRNFAVFSRLTLNQIILPETQYATAEWLLSGAVLGVGANLTTYAIVTQQENPYLYSNLSLSFRLPSQLIITPQVQYEYTHSRVMAARCEVGKYLFRHGYMNISYEQNFKSQYSNIGIGLRYDFSFSQVGFSAWRNNHETSLVQSARGSVVFGGAAGQINMNNRSSVGTGGINLLPFLDLNNNGHRDGGEPKVEGLQIAVNGGRIIHNRRDTTVSILELEPYSHYFIDMSRNNFENIAWRVKHPTVKVAIDPNQVKLVEIPVVVMGELSGTIYLEENSKKAGIGRILLNIYRADNRLAAQVLSESDGFFSFMGLTPGSYSAKVDTAQLQKLGMTASPMIPFHIANKKDGDVVDGLEFFLQRLPDENKIKSQQTAAN